MTHVTWHSTELHFKSVYLVLTKPFASLLKWIVFQRPGVWKLQITNIYVFIQFAIFATV